MPSSVALASPDAVLPAGVCRMFSRSHDYGMDINEWQDGRAAVRVRTATSRKRWQMSRIATAAEADELAAFYAERKGPVKPFYFYDLVDDAGATYDVTGVLTRARYICRFDGSLGGEYPMGRKLLTISLVELA